MNACVDIAVDREPEAIISRFVAPLAARLKKLGIGSVGRYTSDDLWVHVELEISEAADIDHVLEFFAESDAPVGSMIYRTDESGRKHDIFVLGPPSTQ